MTKKLVGFLRLGGCGFTSNIYVWKSKLLYLFFKIFQVLFNLPPTSMGFFLDKNIIAKNSYGKFYCRKKEEDLHIISEHYESKTISVFKKIAKKGSVIMDIGAHIGKYTILAAKFGKKVISIEPSKENFEILKLNVQLNNLANVLLLRIAVGEKNKYAKLFKLDTSGHYSLNSKKATRIFEKVFCERLSIIVRKLNIKTVDLMKIDVEGAEYEVLMGGKSLLRKHKIKNLIIEIGNQNFLKVMKFLTTLGYKIKKIEDNNYLAFL